MQYFFGFQPDLLQSTENVCATILIKHIKAPEKILDTVTAVKWRDALH